MGGGRQKARGPVRSKSNGCYLGNVLGYFLLFASFDGALGCGGMVLVLVDDYIVGDLVARFVKMGRRDFEAVFHINTPANWGVDLSLGVVLAPIQTTHRCLNRSNQGVSVEWHDSWILHENGAACYKSMGTVREQSSVTAATARSTPCTLVAHYSYAPVSGKKASPSPPRVSLPSLL